MSINPITRVFNYIYDNIEKISNNENDYYFRIYNDIMRTQNFGFYINKTIGFNNNGNTTPIYTEENVREYIEIINEVFGYRFRVEESIHN